MLRTAGIVVLALAMAGCGGEASSIKLVECKGNVTYKGKPISGANVVFVVPGNPMSVGTTDSEGNFVITTNGRLGAPVGLAKVGISKPPEGDDGLAEDMGPDEMMKMAEQQPDAADIELPKSPIPEKYASPETSGLTAQISENAADNDFKFILTD